MSINKFLLNLSLIIVPSVALAQFDMDTVMRYSSSLVFKPALNFSASYAPYRRLEKNPTSLLTPVALNYFQGAGNFFMPIWGKFNYTEEFEKPEIIQVSGNAGGSLTRLRSLAPNLGIDHPLINMNLGLNFFWFDGKKSSLTAGAFAFSNEDNYTIASPRIRYTGYVQWRYSISSKIALRIGTTYSFLLGQGLPIPIFGINWRVSPKVLLNINFPFNANLNWTPNHHSLVRFFIQPNGGVSTFGNAIADLGAKSDVVILRRREYKFGASYLHYVKGRFNFSAEMGLLVARRISWTPPNRKNDIGSGLGGLLQKREFSAKLDPAPYVQFGFGYRFGKVSTRKNKVPSSENGILTEIPSDFSEEDIQNFGQLDLGSINLDVQPLNIDAIDSFDLSEQDFRDLKLEDSSDNKK